MLPIAPNADTDEAAPVEQTDEQLEALELAEDPAPYEQTDEQLEALELAEDPAPYEQTDADDDDEAEADELSDPWRDTDGGRAKLDEAHAEALAEAEARTS